MHNRLISILATITIFLISGCHYAGLKRDVKLLDNSTTLSGVVTAKESKSPIVVTLNRVTDEVIELEQYVTVLANNKFHFSVPNGDFYLFAFEDINQNFALDNGESVAFYGSPSLLTVKDNKPIDDITITLLPQREAEALVPDLYTSDNQHSPIDYLHESIGKVVETSHFNKHSGKMGMWEPVRFHEAGNTGIFFLEPYSPSKIPVLFVHGMSGSGYDWRHLISALDRDIYQPWIVQYPSGLRLDLVAKVLYQHVSELTVTYNTDKIIIIAHSMGGLVSKRVLDHEYTATKPQLNVAALITISTPWSGHDSAEIGVRLMPVAVPSWFDMAPSSDFLKKSRSLSLKEYLPHYLFFSYRDNGSLISSQNTDGVVSLNSQLAPYAQDGAVAIYGLNENHTSILKSPDLADKIEAILRALQ